MDALAAHRWRGSLFGRHSNATNGLAEISPWITGPNHVVLCQNAAKKWSAHPARSTLSLFRAFVAANPLAT